MDNSPILNIIFAFALLLIGLMFLEGIWKKKGTVIKSGFNIDNLFFPNLKDKRIIKAGDQVAFLICLFMSLFTLINGLLIFIFGNIPNVSAIFIFVAVVFSWPIRIIFIFSKKNKKYEDIPRIWPFPK